MKAQSTVEFMFVLGLLSLIFIVAFKSIAREFKGVNQYVWANQGRDLAERLATQINDVYLSGSGSYRTVKLPVNLHGGVNYTIIVDPGLVTINVTTYRQEFNWRTITRDINGTDPSQVLDPGNILIENIGNTIYLRHE